MGINFFGGSNKEINLTTQYEKSYIIGGVNPYFILDRNWFGIGVGLHLGNLRWVPLNPINATTVDYGTKFSPIMPEGSLRLGRRDILDLKYTYGFNFPATFPFLVNEFSLGSGFGNKTNFSFRYGFMVFNSGLNKFFSAEGLLNKQIGLTLKYSFGRSEFFNSSSALMEYKNAQRILFGVNYRFGFNTASGKTEVINKSLQR